MHLILHDADRDVSVECSHCHWQGTAGELNEGQYLMLSNITEVFCPACSAYLGFIQHASSDEEKGN